MEQRDAVIGDLGPGLLESMLRFRVLLAALTVVGGFAGLLVSLAQTPIYEATNRLLLSDPASSGLFGGIRGSAQDADRHVRNQVELIRSGVVLPGVVDQIDGRLAIDDLEEAITVESLPDVDVLEITATDDSPAGAAGLANAAAESYMTLIVEQVAGTAQEAISELQERNSELTEQIPGIPFGAAGDAARTALLAQITENEGRIQQITVDAELFGSGVEVFAPADPPDDAARPQPVRNVAAGALLALLLGGALAWWRNSVSQRVESPQDPAAILHAPLLGVVPVFSRAGVEGHLPTVTAPLSPAAEAYQFVASSLAVTLADLRGHRILVTSARPGDGKTVSVLNLAVVSRRERHRVTMIDADQRVQGLTQICGIELAPNLESVRHEGVPADWTRTIVRPEEGLHIPLLTVSSGENDPAAYFRTAAFQRSLDRAESDADLLLIDTPPLLAVSETSAIAGHVDGIVLVVDEGTPLRILEEVSRRLEFIGTPLLGYIYNRARARRASYGYGGQTHGYGATGARADAQRSDGPLPAPPRGGPHERSGAIVHGLKREPHSSAGGSHLTPAAGDEER